MYSDIVGTFLDSVRSLRYYVDSVEKNMETYSVIGEELNMHTAMALSMHTVMKAKQMGLDVADVVHFDDIPSNLPENVSREDYEKGMNVVKDLMLSLNSLIREKVIDGKTLYEYTEVPKDIKKKYREIEIKEKQTDILYSGSLMLLVTYFENLISGVMKKDFIKHPERISLDEKSVSYKMLTDFGNINDVKEFLIDQEVTNKMYCSYSEWKVFFEKKMKLEVLFWNSNFSQIQEIIARRNIFVHNNGVINNIYISLVGNKDGKLHIGDTILINREYIDKAINILEYAGVSLAIEAWIKEYANDENEVKNIIDFIFEEYLVCERWEIAKQLYEICLKSNKICDADRILCQINCWQCYKWLGQYNEIEKAVSEVDVSALRPVYNLGILALKEEYKEFFKYYDRQDDIGEAELKEWPLFSALRRSEEYIRRFPELIDDVPSIESN